MKKDGIRDTLVIVIPKGYTVDEMLDFYDEGKVFFGKLFKKFKNNKIQTASS